MSERTAKEETVENQTNHQPTASSKHAEAQITK